MGDVIGHTPDPVAFLELARLALRPGGLLMVVTADFESLMGRLLQIKSREHLVYFTQRSLATAARTAGFPHPSVKRWGRQRSIDAMRHSTTFSGRAQRLVALLSVPVVRPLIERTLFRCFKDELLLTEQSSPARPLPA